MCRGLYGLRGFPTVADNGWRRGAPCDNRLFDPGQEGGGGEGVSPSASGERGRERGRGSVCTYVLCNLCVKSVSQDTGAAAVARDECLPPCICVRIVCGHPDMAAVSEPDPSGVFSALEAARSVVYPPASLPPPSSHLRNNSNHFARIKYKKIT